ncbi:TadE family protein [candidate division CSSED10-310 bacterium]|uniref:TadE family protein n=1 Tax=candidate division CSSED10-310 bacterium TaxID=2855610 RepID=A0ABV6YX69_UNCC1
MRFDRLLKRHQKKDETGFLTLDFIFTTFWILVFLFIFVQFAMMTTTYQIVNYACHAAARSVIANGDYRSVARNVCENTLTSAWGDTVFVQWIPGIGVTMLYWKNFDMGFFSLPMPIFGRAGLPFWNGINPIDPRFWVFHVGDNDGDPSLMDLPLL